MVCAEKAGFLSILQNSGSLQQVSNAVFQAVHQKILPFFLEPQIVVVDMVSLDDRCRSFSNKLIIKRFYDQVFPEINFPAAISFKK